jgi:hypothetical protein
MIFELYSVIKYIFYFCTYSTVNTNPSCTPPPRLIVINLREKTRFKKEHSNPNHLWNTAEIFRTEDRLQNVARITQICSVHFLVGTVAVLF